MLEGQWEHGRFFFLDNSNKAFKSNANQTISCFFLFNTRLKPSLASAVNDLTKYYSVWTILHGILGRKCQEQKAIIRCGIREANLLKLLVNLLDRTFGIPYKSCRSLYLEKKYILPKCNVQKWQQNVPWYYFSWEWPAFGFGTSYRSNLK